MPDLGRPGTPAPRPARPVRRAIARQAARRAQRQALHEAPLAPPASPARAAARRADPAQPLADTILQWVEVALADQGHARPTAKRLAVLVAGLLSGDRGTPSGVAHAAFTLGVGTAQQEPSVARRVARLLDDPQLDPARLLPDLAAALLPTLLAEVGRAHDHSIGTRPAHEGHHRRWIGVRLIVDETTHTDQTHVLAVGLAYRGTVVPLGVRTWPQTTALPERAYWSAVGSLLWEVQAQLPPVLRTHVLVLADRGYGVPTMLDLLAALGWQWVVRVQGQTRLCFPDGTERALRTLVTGPGTRWTGYTAWPTDPATATAAPLPVFKRAGWRPLHVVAAWATGQAEPWLLVTTLPPTAARLADYAARWAIERLFLAWKSHGWDLEAVRRPTSPRLARLLTGYVVATWWLLAAALPVAQAHLDALAEPPARGPRRPVQLRLPLFPPNPPAPAKRSLLTYGRQVFQQLPGRTATPLLCWTFPDWDAPTWAVQCQQVYQGLAS
jgi:Transposase DDE domain